MSSQTFVPTTNQTLIDWVEEVAGLTRPDKVHWCDGSAEEYDTLAQGLVEAGTFERLSDAKRPNSYLALSDPADVARVEDRTFICSPTEAEAGPTNNWRAPHEMREMLTGLFDGCDEAGARCTSCPFSMGPLGSDKSHIGVQLTDSAYVAVSMRIMTRMGRGALDVLGADGEHLRALPALRRACRWMTGWPTSPWPCNADNKYIVHFTREREIWSYGSGYGGNALLGKKCFALRIASIMARDEGWMAEHMLILKLTSPEGEVKVRHRGVPQRVRQDQPGHARPHNGGLEGRDGRRRHRVDEVRRGRRLYAINPEAGFFGVAPGTGEKTNPTRWRPSGRTPSSPTCARTDDGDVWWEGMTDSRPLTAIDWHGDDWTPESTATPPSAHPNARFTAPAGQ